MQNCKLNKLYTVRLIFHSLKQKSQAWKQKLALYFSVQRAMQERLKKMTEMAQHMKSSNSHGLIVWEFLVVKFSKWYYFDWQFTILINLPALNLVWIK